MNDNSASMNIILEQLQKNNISIERIYCKEGADIYNVLITDTDINPYSVLVLPRKLLENTIDISTPLILKEICVSIYSLNRVIFHMEYRLK